MIDPGLGLNGSIIAGATVGGVVLLMIILVVVLVVMRRRRRSTKARLEKFGGQSAVEALRDYRLTLAQSRSSLKHAESTTHLSYADKTVVNTLMEMSLPGFLLVDYATSVQPGPVIEVRTLLIFILCMLTAFVLDGCE